ncbi:MAG: hypothetical protein U0556_16260 [Dehalococcoidia bacterium]
MAWRPVCGLAGLSLIALAWLPASSRAISNTVGVQISEVDADQASTDSAEFVELSGVPGTPLDGFRLVFFSAGSSAYPAYRTVRLDGWRIGARGVLVVGSAMVGAVDLIAWETNGIQNATSAPDAVALYRDDAAPHSPTGTSLVDVLTYGTRDDPTFRARFGPLARPLQATDSPTSAISRGPDGQFRSDWPPSPGFANAPVRLSEVGADGQIELAGIAGSPIDGYAVALYDATGTLATSGILSGTLPAGGAFPGGLVVGSLPLGAPVGERRAVVLTGLPPPPRIDPVQVRDAVVIGRGDSPVRAQLGLPAEPPPPDGQTLSRWTSGAGLGAPFGPASPSLGLPNLPPDLADLTIGTTIGPVIAPDGCRFPPRWIGRQVRLAGIVTALVRDGSRLLVALQDGGDDDPATPDAILVDGLGPATANIGERLKVRGVVGWRNGQSVLNGATIEQRSGSEPLPEPLLLEDPPFNPCTWARLAAQRVTLPAGASAVGPRIVLGSGDSFVDLLPAGDGDPYERRVFAPANPAFVAGSASLVRLTGQALRALDAAAALAPSRTFDVLRLPATGVVIPLSGRPSLAVETPPAFDPGPAPDGNDAPIPPATLRVATINLQNFFDRLDDPADPEDDPGAPTIPANFARYVDRLAKIAMLVLDRSGAPDLLVIQEVEDQDLCHDGGQQFGRCGQTDGADGKLDVLADLAHAILARSAGSVGYAQIFDRRGADSRGIVTAILYRPDTLSLLGVELRQTVADPIVEADGDGGMLFARPPLLAQLMTRSGDLLTVIGVHFKSDPNDFRPRRAAQAAFAAALVRDALSASPGALIALAGDFNDDAGSPVLAPLRLALPGGTLTAALDRTPATGRYSYVFGGVAEAIDQIYLAPALAARLVDIRAVHLNADWPDSAALDPTTPYRVSDHDPVVASFGPTARYSLFVPAVAR